MPASTLERRAAHAHLAFALAVQRALFGGGVDAACWSPFSVASALGLAATGARGRTQAELTRLLLGTKGDLADHSVMLEAAGLPDGGTPTVLAVANTLWTREDLQIHRDFLTELARWPNGRTRTAPFREQPETARRLINADVAEATRGLIPELLARGTIRRETAATLVNALYLKTAWVNAFPEHATQRQPFRTPTGTTRVPTMRLYNKTLRYASVNAWQVIVLPGGGGVEAVVLLPSDPDLAAAEASLDADVLTELVTAPQPTPVDLYLPKFKVRAKAGLTAALNRLGVTTMFGDDADFSGISPTPLAVDGVEHEAVLTVDEQGLEGAAATAVVFRALSLRMPVVDPIVVRVDRPFLFLVRHRSTGALYFLARVSRP